MNAVINNFIEESIDKLCDTYKYLHQNPELSLQEKETSVFLQNKLKLLGYEIIKFDSCYGFVAILKNGDGPFLLYRTDMDALPIEESSGAEYSSKKKAENCNGELVPVAHMCGHDMHMTIWLGVAQFFTQFKNSFQGTLMFVAQPAEELGVGAKIILQDKLFNDMKPEYCLAFHINPLLKAGGIGICEGYSMAGVDFIDITFFGIGGHSASPHLNVDPVILASQFVMNAQTIVSRNINPLNGAVVSISSIHGGTNNNITPDRVKLKLTIRWFKDEIRNIILGRIKEIANGIAMGAGLPETHLPLIEINQDSNIPSMYNDIELSGRIKEISIDILSKENVIDVEAQMFGEDFCYYSREVENTKSMLVWLGSTAANILNQNDETIKIPGLHSPKLILDIENSIYNGVVCMVNYISQLSKASSIKKINSA